MAVHVEQRGAWAYRVECDDARNRPACGQLLFARKSEAERWARAHEAWHRAMDARQEVADNA